MNKNPIRATRLILSILCGTLLLACPGSSAYAASGKIVSVQVNAPVNTSVGMSGASIGTLFSNRLDVQPASLTTGLNGSMLPTLAVPIVVGKTLTAPADPAGFSVPTPEATLLRTESAVPAKAEPVIAAETAIAPLAAVPAEKSGTVSPAAQETAVTEQAEAIAAQPGRLAAPASRIRAGILATIKSIFSSRKDAGGIPSAVNAAESLAATQISGVSGKISPPGVGANTQINIRRTFGGNSYDYIDIEPTVHYKKALAAARRNAKDARLVNAQALLWSMLNDESAWLYVFYSVKNKKTISVQVTAQGNVSTELEKGHPKTPRGKLINISRIKVSFQNALSIAEDAIGYPEFALFYVELRPPLATSANLAYYFFDKTGTRFIGVSAEDGSIVEKLEWPVDW